MRFYFSIFIVINNAPVEFDRLFRALQLPRKINFSRNGAKWLVQRTTSHFAVSRRLLVPDKLARKGGSPDSPLWLVQRAIRRPLAKSES